MSCSGLSTQCTSCSGRPPRELKPSACSRLESFDPKLPQVPYRHGADQPPSESRQTSPESHVELRAAAGPCFGYGKLRRVLRRTCNRESDPTIDQRVRDQLTRQRTRGGAVGTVNVNQMSVEETDGDDCMPCVHCPRRALVVRWSTRSMN